MSRFDTWASLELGEVCKLRGGAAFKPALQGRKNGEFPFIKVSDFNLPGNEARINGANNWVDAADSSTIQGQPFPASATVFAKIGEALKHNRKRFLTRPTYIDNNLMGAVAKSEIVHPDFLFQLFRTIDIAASDVGTAVPYVKASTLEKIPVVIPPLETQRRIASILGAYDDLIEVNRRRIAVLEEMARGLFEEWFVRFRFPGHEAVPTLDTPDGPVPEGWTWGAAANLIAFDPRTPISRDGLKPFISMGHLDTATSLIASPETRDGNSGAKFRNGDTLFARITPCLENGKTGLVRGLPGQDGIGFGSTEFIVMRGEAAGPAFTYCLARQSSFRDNARNSMSGATGRQRARTESLAAFAMPVPALDLLRQFDAMVWPMLELVGSLGVANAKLATSRDLLLPRLISGQLSVADAERELEEAA